MMSVDVAKSTSQHRRFDIDKSVVVEKVAKIESEQDLRGLGRRVAGGKKHRVYRAGRGFAYSLDIGQYAAFLEFLQCANVGDAFYAAERRLSACGGCGS